MNAAVPPVSISTTRLLVQGIIGLCTLCVGFVLGISFLRPTQDNQSMITTVLGVIVPAITAMLAALGFRIYHMMNSRLTELVDVTATSKLAEGKILGEETGKSTMMTALAEIERLRTLIEHNQREK